MGSVGEVQGYLVKVNADYPHAPAQIELRQNERNEITFGRGVGNTVVWESLQISRRHSVMEYRAETHQWRLKDTSTNGMMINQQKVPKNGFVDLKDQDLISFVPTGALSYRFVAVPDPHQAQSLNNNNFNRRAAPILEAHITNNNVPQNLTTERRSPPDDDGVEIYDVVPAKSPKRKPNHGDMIGKMFGQCISPPMGKRKKIPAYPFVDMDMDCDNDEVVPLFRDNQVPVISSRKHDDLRLRSENIPLKSSTADVDDATKKQLAMYREQIRLMESEKYETNQKHQAETKELLNKLQMSQSENRVSQEVVYKKVIDLIDSEYSCCICSEVFIQATVVDCGHTFCGHCIAEWVKRKTECPNCRKAVKQQSRHTEMENFISKFFELLPDDMTVKRNEIIAERKKEQEDAARAAAAAQRNMMPGPRASVYGVHDFFNNMHEIVNPPRHDRMRFMAGLPDVGGVGPPRFGAHHFIPEMPHLQHMQMPQPNAVFVGADMRRGAAPYPMPTEAPRTRSARRRVRPVNTYAPMAHQQAPQPPMGLDFVTVD